MKTTDYLLLKLALTRFRIADRKCCKLAATEKRSKEGVRLYDIAYEDRAKEAKKIITLLSEYL